MHFVQLQAVARGKNPQEAKINYWGISYGTILGQTLVAMYPNQIRRVLLDGNAYGVAWYQGWSPAMVEDMSQALRMFSKLCFEAGPRWCALSKGMSSVNKVQERIHAVLPKLETEADREFFMHLVQRVFYGHGNDGGYRLLVQAILSQEKGYLRYVVFAVYDSSRLVLSPSLYLD